VPRADIADAFGTMFQANVGNLSPDIARFEELTGILTRLLAR